MVVGAKRCHFTFGDIRGVSDDARPAGWCMDDRKMEQITIISMRESRWRDTTPSVYYRWLKPAR